MDERYAGTRELVAEWEGTVTQVRHDVTLSNRQLSISEIRVHVLADPIPDEVSATVEEYVTWLVSAGWEEPWGGPRPDPALAVPEGVPVQASSDVVDGDGDGGDGATGRLGLTVLDFPE